MSNREINKALEEEPKIHPPKNYAPSFMIFTLKLGKTNV